MPLPVHVYDTIFQRDYYEGTAHEDFQVSSPRISVTCGILTRMIDGRMLYFPRSHHTRKFDAMDVNRLLEATFRYC